ncbi:hypothetical protein KIW84_012587 [Lathyrus oleraceus]|uniref:Uncharacterized protein n=1 Tax=Pisum sativum TaxID=3888 RepID=A0A9D5BI42_PEA|nr:hypothetical protein KIW84_012587 [Pisum sativum]
MKFSFNHGSTFQRIQLLRLIKKGDSFWNKIGEACNKHRDINSSVQKFVGCYKQALSTQQSGSSESNIMQAAFKIYFQDEALGQHDEYFRMMVDATGMTSLSPLQKCTVVIRILAYGTSTDNVDDYLRISETTTLKYVRDLAEPQSSGRAASDRWRPTIIVNEVAQQRKRKCATAGLAEAIQCRVASDVGFQDRKGLRLGGDGATVTTMVVFG